MKKNIFKAAGLALALFALAVNVSKAVNGESQDVNLFDLANATEANAECPPTSIGNGRCSSLTGNCYWDWPDHTECDTSGHW